jgi:hypothetical protein
MAVDLAGVFAARGNLSVFLDQRFDQIVHRDEFVRLCRHIPQAQTHDIVAGFGLPFRHQGQ